MKAVIVDLLNGQAAALCDDGRVIKLANASYSLGQIVEIHEQKRSRPKWARMIASVAAAAVLLMGVGGAAYAMPYGVVSLDVNPSIEYTINCFRYVLSVEGVNDAGKAVLAEMDSSQLIHRRIDDALEESLTQIEAGDWLTESSDDVLLAAGVNIDAHSERLVTELANGLRARHGNLEIHALAVSREDIDAARKTGLSPGRQHILHERSESAGMDINPVDWADRSVGDILNPQDNGTMMHVSTDPQSTLPEQRRVQGDQQQKDAQHPQAQPIQDHEPSQNQGGDTPQRQQPTDNQTEPRQDETAFDFSQQEPPAVPAGEAPEADTSGGYAPSEPSFGGGNGIGDFPGGHNSGPSGIPPH